MQLNVEAGEGVAVGQEVSEEVSKRRDRGDFGRSGPASRFSKSHLVAAICLLHAMRGNSFDRFAMPRLAMSKMLGINRWRMIRVIQAAQEGMALAVALDKRLKRYDAAPKKKMGRPPGKKGTPRALEQTLDDRQDKAKRENDNQDFKTKGQRNRNMSMRPVRQDTANESS
jgi:hypothetical protein